MSEPLPQFTGGKGPVRAKLNRMVDRLNSLSSSRGDGTTASGTTGSGTTQRTAMNILRRRIPKTVPGVTGIFPVVVKLVSGSAGSLTGPCTYVYDVYPMGTTAFIAANRIGIALTPKTKRKPIGKYAFVPDDPSGWGYAQAFVDREGNIALYHVAGERPGAKGC